MTPTIRPSPSADPEALIERFAALIGRRNVLDDPVDIEPHLIEWRDLFHGRTPFVLAPGTTEEVAACVSLANELGVPIIPQSGNTGLVGGQVPDDSGREIVLSLHRLDRILDIDPDGFTITVQAGVVLERVHEAARAQDRLFPLSLASEGSCRIGGNIATNAGGTSVIAYGNTRDLVLGLEVVLPTGEVLSALRRLRKDNSGYDLKHLFIGCEGTLGIITAAVLKLFPLPAHREVAIAATDTPAQAVALLTRMRSAAGGHLTAFELMSAASVEFALRHAEGVRDPFPGQRHPYYTLIEISAGDTAEPARKAVEAALEAALEAGEITDAVLAESLDQASAFWRIRHSLSEVQRFEGGSIKHDIAVPVAAVPTFLARADAAVTALVPGCRPVPFGHLGDGNVHYNVSQPPGMDKAAYLAQWESMNVAVHAIVRELGGSISAEHGVGRLKRALLPSVRSPVEIDVMRKIRTVLDPNGILSPGRVL